MARIAAAVVLVVLIALAILYWIGSGGPGERWEEGVATPTPLAAATVSARDERHRAAAERLGVPRPKQVLFGDLHVHTTFSPDAFAMALPITGGAGARPVSDACDYARYCAALDFWSVNDHAVGITPWKWEQTVQAIRDCDAVGGANGAPDTTAFLGWEWTQMGTTPENHYGHKNVVLRDLDEVPDRPVAAASPQGMADGRPSPFVTGLLGVFQPEQDIFDLLRFNADLDAMPDCPLGVPVREQEAGCRDSVATPEELFTRLDDWGFDSVVIPHGTTWGMYTPLGSAWDKQLPGNDPARQTLIEVFSGHGNSEEFRSWREIAFDASGAPSCPEPAGGFLPSCWRAGEIIAERCRDAGESESECDSRAATARQHYVEADVSGHLVVPGSTPDDWLDSGQCPDCFQPSFNYRPRSSVQYIMALRDFGDAENPKRFDFGFMASSDNHSARPGTGYKEIERLDVTEARLGALGSLIDMATADPEEPAPRSRAFVPEDWAGQFFSTRETERAGSFFMTGGLTAVHAEGRGRQAVWDAMQRKEVYGTSGPRILLWFDLLNPPGSLGRGVPMGGSTAMADAPIFQVRAAGSFEQKPGCPEEVTGTLEPEHLERLCSSECYFPSDRRRAITRIEIVRVTPQDFAGEAVEELIQDPWRVFQCAPNPDGCVVTFTDPDFASGARDVLYYARAIEAPSLAVAHDPLGCERDEQGRCLSVSPCRARDDDCLAPAEERAWSSPIFVEHVGRAEPAGAAGAADAAGAALARAGAR